MPHINQVIPVVIHIPYPTPTGTHTYIALIVVADDGVHIPDLPPGVELLYSAECFGDLINAPITTEDR